MHTETYRFEVSDRVINDDEFIGSLARADAAGDAIQKDLELIAGTVGWAVEPGPPTFVVVSYEAAVPKYRQPINPKLAMAVRPPPRAVGPMDRAQAELVRVIDQLRQANRLTTVEAIAAATGTSEADMVDALRNLLANGFAVAGPEPAKVDDTKSNNDVVSLMVPDAIHDAEEILGRWG